MNHVQSFWNTGLQAYAKIRTPRKKTKVKRQKNKEDSV
jgi:hypothetical protein